MDISEENQDRQYFHANILGVIALTLCVLCLFLPWYVWTEERGTDGKVGRWNDWEERPIGLKYEGGYPKTSNATYTDRFFWGSSEIGYMERSGLLYSTIFYFLILLIIVRGIAFMVQIYAPESEHEESSNALRMERIVKLSSVFAMSVTLLAALTYPFAIENAHSHDAYGMSVSQETEDGPWNSLWGHELIEADNHGFIDFYEQSWHPTIGWYFMVIAAVFFTVSTFKLFRTYHIFWALKAQTHQEAPSSTPP